MNKLRRSFSTKLVNEINWNEGVTSFCSWESLYKQLAIDVRLKSYEKIIGIEITDDGIYCKIEHK